MYMNVIATQVTRRASCQNPGRLPLWDSLFVQKNFLLGKYALLGIPWAIQFWGSGYLSLALSNPTNGEVGNWELGKRGRSN